MDSNKFLVIEQLRLAHGAAHKAYSFLTEASDRLLDAEGVFDDDFETQIEELTVAADNLQASLFDLLEDNDNE